MSAVAGEFDSIVTTDSSTHWQHQELRRVFDGCKSLTIDVGNARDRKAGLGKGIDTPHKLLMLCVKTTQTCSSTISIKRDGLTGPAVLTMKHKSVDRGAGMMSCKIFAPDDGQLIAEFGRGVKPLRSIPVHVMGQEYGSVEFSRPRVFTRANCTRPNAAKVCVPLRLGNFSKRTDMGPGW